MDDIRCLARHCRARRVLLWLCRYFGWALQHVPTRLVDREMCLAAVGSDTRALEHVPEALRDHGVCLAAVAASGCYLGESGLALSHVPEGLRDVGMCVAAMKNTRLGSCVICHVPEPIRETVWAATRGG